MTTLHLRNSISRSPWRGGFFLIPLVLACFALSPSARGIKPAPDGGYANGNTAEGDSALQNLTTGNANTALGNVALFKNTAGSQNTATGAGALFNNLLGTRNTANGFVALFSDTVDDNTAVGWAALANNTIGSDNTAIGSQAAASNVTGANINAVGFQALFSNNGVPPQGSFNNAHGNFALSSNTTGRQNNAFGHDALSTNVTGNFNTAIGDFAGSAITRNWNIDIGKDVIGIGGATGDNFVTRIGIGDPTDAHAQLKCFIGGIGNAAVTGTPVVVNTTTGQLGVAGASSARFKTQIKPMDKASEAILALKPITFRYKQEIDPAGIPQFGLVAEEVAKVNPALVTRDAKGELYTVRYDAVNAMLLNEFLKEHRTVQELKKEIAALTAKVQKVSAQVETSRPVPQTVVDNH